MGKHHHIDYIEFSVTDIDQAKNFYEKAFTWKFTDYAPNYIGIQKEGGGEMGGFTLVDKVSSGGPLVVLYSEKLEETLQKVQSAEGKLLKEIFEFPGGRRFEFQDPCGNHLAVWSDK